MPLHGHAYRASLTSQSSASCHTSGGFMHNTGGVSNRGPYTGSPSNSVGIGGEGGGQPHSPKSVPIALLADLLVENPPSLLPFNRSATRRMTVV